MTPVTPGWGGSLGTARPACIPCSASCGHPRAHSLPPSPRPWPKSILGCVNLGCLRGRTPGVKSCLCLSVSWPQFSHL